jgi:hypothetical protein
VGWLGILLGGAVAGAVCFFLLMAPLRKQIEALATPAIEAQQPEQQHQAQDDTLTPTPPDTAGEDEGTASTQEETNTIEYDRTNAQQVMAYLVYTIFQNQPWMIRDLVGADGCSFAPYATGAEIPGYNNAKEIGVEMEQALVDSDATCLGYGVVENGLPDKATMYWMGLRFDWQRLGLGDYAADVTAFEFFKIDGEWRLSYICPVPEDLVPDGDELLTCPMDFIPAVE